MNPKLSLKHKLYKKHYQAKYKKSQKQAKARSPQLEFDFLNASYTQHPHTAAYMSNDRSNPLPILSYSELVRHAVVVWSAPAPENWNWWGREPSVANRITRLGW